MPWIPELFSAEAVEHIQERHPDELVTIPYFDGLLAGDIEPLVGSFVGVPELYDPVRGRVKGTRAFEGFVHEIGAWLRDRNCSVRHVDRVRAEGCGCEEVELELDHDAGRITHPVAIVGIGRPDWRLEELRIYFSRWALTGHHLNRPPLLQPGSKLALPPIVAEYLRALAEGELETILGLFEQDGYVREPADAARTHQGRDELRAFYEREFSGGGGVRLEQCAAIFEGRSCTLEYNTVRWGRSEIAPQAGVAVYTQGPAGKLTAVRLYDDVDPAVVFPS